MLLFFLVLLLALLNVICYVPMLGAVLMKIQAFHRRVSSDIPGNPHMFDACIISMMRTLPEPSNFNLIWTNVPFAEPLILRGTFCKSRFNSLSIYGSNMCDPPNSLDLADINANPDGSFELTISRDPTAESSNNICSNDWAGGFISMRNYLVPPGTDVKSPEIVRMDGTVIRKSEMLVAGPSQLTLGSSKLFIAMCRIVPLNICFYISLLNMNVSSTGTNTMICCGLVLSILLYQTMFLLGRLGLRKFFTGFGPQNQLTMTSLEAGSKASQPSALHKYWTMPYSVPVGGQIRVTGKIDTTYQKYWSFIVYDEYGLPLSRYVYDVNVNRIPIKGEASEVSPDSSSSSSSCNLDRYCYDIRMTNYGTEAHTEECDLNAHTTGVDVSACPKGYVIFRIVHPTSDKTVEFSTPTATVLLPKVDTTKDTKKIQ